MSEMLKRARDAEERLRAMHSILDRALMPGGSDTDTVAMHLSKRDIAMLIVVIEEFLTHARLDEKGELHTRSSKVGCGP